MVYIKDKEIKKVLNDNNLLFNYELPSMVMIINNYFNDQQKMSILRNERFINMVNTLLLEQILTNMHFESVFNMLQNKNILDKINNLDVCVINPYPKLVISYLNSKSLISKTSSNMIYKLLLNLDNTDVENYLSKKYILDKIDNIKLVELAINKDIDINTSKLNNNELEKYIDNKLLKTKNIDYINNKDITKRLFNLTNDTLKRINFDEVKYLYESINTKSIITIQDNNCSIRNYKGVLSLYLIFGFDHAKKIANKELTFTVKQADTIINKLTDLDLYQFKINNYKIFDNMFNKVINELDKYNNIYEIKDSAYLRNVVSLSNLYNYKYLINEINNYYLNKNKEIIYKSINDLLSVIYNKQKDIYYKDNKNKVVNLFSIKNSTIYNYKNKYSSLFIKKLKIRLLIDTLKANNKDAYKDYYKNNIDVTNINNIYSSKLSKDNIDLESVINYILIPYAYDYNNNLFNNNDYSEIIEQVINKTINFINYYVDTLKTKMKYYDDYENYINNIKINIPFNHYNYEYNNKILGINDYYKLFNGYDLNKKIKNKNKLLKFMNDNKLFNLLSSNYFDNNIYNIGFVINYFDNMKDIKLENINISLLNYLNNIIPNYISINSFNKILESNISLNIDDIQNNYINNLKINEYPIPYIKGIIDNNNYELIDLHSEEVLVYNNNCYYIKVNNNCILSIKRIMETIIISNYIGYCSNNIIKDIADNILSNSDICLVLTDINDYHGIKINSSLINLNIDDDLYLISSKKDIDESINKNNGINYLRKRNKYKTVDYFSSDEDMKYIKILINIYSLDKSILNNNYIKLYYGDDWIITVDYNNNYKVYNENEFNKDEIDYILKNKVEQLSSTFLILF